MLPSFLKKRGKLQRAWRYTSEGIIWRIVLTSKGRLVGESRTLDTKEVSFFCVDASTGTPLWQGATFGEQWWMGMEAVCGETLFLHKYATPNMPGHKGIIAVDVASGRQLWLNEELTFEFGADDVVLASQNTIQGFQFFQLDVHTGTSVQELSAAEAKSLRVYDLVEERINSDFDALSEVVTPAPILELAEDSSEHAIVIRDHCDARELVGPVEFLEHNNVLIFNYHQRSSSSTEEHVNANNILKIVDKRSGIILFDTIMNMDSSSVVPETFFMQGNMLMYVHERTTLTAIDLTSTSLQ